jgi:hypothetical protein
LKGILVSLLIVVVAVVLLVAPWYQIPTTYQATNTFSQTFTQTLANTFQVGSTSQQAQTVYTLDNPITVQGTPNIYTCATNPTTYTCGAWASTPFVLTVGSSIIVTCSCHGVIGIYSYFAPYKSVDFTLNGKPPTNQSDAIVPVTGLYNVAVFNLQPSPITEAGITVIEQTPLTTSFAETNYQTASNTEYNTVMTTETSSTNVAPSSVLGNLPSVIIVGVIVAIVILITVIDLGLIHVTMGKQKRRRK